MQDNEQSPENPTVTDPVESVAPGVSLLDSILLLLTPEQRQHFLESAGIEGVVYANRAPTFDKPLALKLTKRAFTELRNMLEGSSSSGEWEQQIDFNDPTPLYALKAELEAGVRFAPPPLDWFKKHLGSEDMPIRVETRRFGIPCKLCRFQYREGSFLLATFVGTPDTRRDSKDPEVEEVVPENEALVDPVDVEHLSVVPEEPAPAPNYAERGFVPHARTTWDVLGPYEGDAPDIDAAALERLVLQVATNRRYNALSRATRERCEILEGLVRLKQFASQYPYTLASQSGDTFEFQVEGPPEALAGMKRAYVYRDMEDGSRRDRVAGIILERVGRRNQCQVFRIPEGFQCDTPPASGYLVDTGDISQLQKQLDALRELRHPSSRPHLLQLGTLLSSDNGGLGEPASWKSVPILMVDDKLTERQAEAVRKALATPDICLIQGPPGTGKTRVISEIVRQAVRANWKVLLVAPTHVAVDNVLERIGIQEEVSPVRCVRQEKLDDLPEHIQEFTYERRSGLLAHETGRRSEADRSTWQHRFGRLASALEVLKQGADYRVGADQIEGEIAGLLGILFQAPTQVRSQFANETRLARSAEQAAEEALNQATKASQHCRQELARWTGRVADLGAQRYTAEDRSRVEEAEAAVRREQAPAIESATREKDDVSATVSKLAAEESGREKMLAEAKDILAALDQGQVPPLVQRVVDDAVTETTRQQDKTVAQRQEALSGLQEQFQDVQRRIGDFDRKSAIALAHSVSLKEAQAKAVPLRLLSGSWWGSFFTDYEQNAAEASKQSSTLQEQCPALKMRIREAEESLEQARVSRLKAIETTRSQALEQQHDHYRDMVGRLPEELERIRSDLRDSQQRLQLREATLEARLEACRQAVEKARAATHEGILAAAESSLTSADGALEDSERTLADANKRLAAAHEQVAAVAARIQQETEHRTGELNRAIEAQDRKLTGFRESFAAAVATLTDVLAGPLAFEAARIETATRQLTAEHEQARRRLTFLEEWTQFLSRESGQLRDRLAQYVNLVCATTIGIATDEYFGDKGAFVEKQFDLLVIDEAGKVTEPEFLVAAVRAKRWVLVGDHKQLPPYYDQLLDPYLHSANEARRAADQPLLDPQALRLSIFERLWWRFNPGQRPAFRQTDPAAAEASAHDGRAQDEADDAMPLDPSESWDAAYDQAEQSDMMWQQRQTEKAWDEKRRGDQLEEMWSQQRSGQAGDPRRSRPKEEPAGDAASPNTTGVSRCVTLDVQRRMHPDLAVFISEMFYDGQYFSPEGEAFLASKAMDLTHFPKPVTLIDICPGKGSDGYEVDLSRREERKRFLAEHDSDLPDRGFANPREAEQVVQVLEAIVKDAAVDREQAELQRAGDQVPLVGVIALYAGQVALIHRLIRMSSALKAERVSGSEWLCGGARVAVNSVDAFQGKECPIVILSFTRSNRRQAVGFVDDPHRLNVALSRARKKLVLVGDSETLTRRARAQLGGQRDNRAAKQERFFFTQLVRYVEGRGKTMRIFERRSVK